jgi:hypothetical protein
MVTVWPATRIVPVRRVSATLRATVNRTSLGPAPEAPLVIVIHDAWLCAVHAQPAAVSTRTDSVRSMAATVSSVRESA